MRHLLLAVTMAVVLVATSVPTTSHAGMRGFIIAGMVVLATSMGPLNVRPAMPPRMYY